MFDIANAALAHRDNEMTEANALSKIMSVGGFSKEQALSYLKSALTWPRPGYGELDERGQPVQQISAKRYMKENF